MIKKYPLYYNLDTGGGADVSGVTATAGDVDTGKVFVNSSGTEVTGTSTYKSDYTALNTLVGQTTAVAEDVAQGKVFVNASGVQTTGTASGGGSDEDLVKMIERPSNAEVTIPNGVTIISKGAFEEFEMLINVNIPNTVTTISHRGFSGCSNLALTSLPNSITTLGNGAFEYCSNLALTSLPSGITSIEANTFQYCTKLAITSLPSGLTSIGKNAFYLANNYGAGLPITSIPASVTTIGQNAFHGCYMRGTLTFLGTPTTIHAQAFTDNSNLTTIRVPWAQGAVSGAPWGSTNATIVYNYTP